ncbi:MAG: ATP-binding protein [Alphaproteobacteria bacterium]|nr:ATP-binding protein [Alphaproteobacteria bacterium]
MTLIRRHFKDPDQSFFLFGPRGTGKSTLIRSLYKEAIWVDLLKPEILRGYLARPEKLEELINGNPHKKNVVIDEIQKAPQLLSVIHHLIEQKKGLKFILTGSNARKIKRMHADLLGGRALKKELYPFMASELGDQFSLEVALSTGMLPLLVASKNPQETLAAYSALYVHEEVQTEGFIRSIEDFSRFLEAVSFSHGSILNTSNIARECDVKRKTVEGFLDVLEDLLLSFKVPVFTKRAVRSTSTHPKFYLFDVGLYKGLRPRGLLDRPEEIEGMALEGLVAQHLRAWINYGSARHTLSFWRTRSGTEVDFIVYGELGFWALEVKNAQTVRSSDLKSLEAFLSEYPEAKAFLLYRGKEILKRNNVLCVPVDIFLRQLLPNQALWDQ